MISVREYINQKGFEYRERGENAVMNCPFCGDKESKFAINLTTGAFNCLHLNTCGQKGSFWNFQELLGDKPQSVFKANIFIEKSKKSYIKPRVLVPPATSKVTEYLTYRKFTQATIDHFKVGSKDDHTVMLPYYRNGELINIKYRSIDKKEFTAEKNAEPILFNHDNAANNESMLVICEGEFDAMALYQYGIEAVSVPNGASGFNWVENEWEFLQRFKKIYICFDNDSAGQSEVFKLAAKLGKWRCRNVVLPFKDANECLINGLSFDEISVCFGNASDFAPAYLASPLQFQDEILELFTNNPNLNGTPTAWDKLTKILRGWREEELTVWNGKNGSGKSTMLNMHILDMAAKGIRSCIASLELPAKRYLRWAVIQKIENSMPSTKQVREVLKYLDDYIYIVNSHEELTPEEIFEVFEYAARRYDVKHFIVDSLSRVRLPGKEDLKEEKRFVSDLLTFCKKFSCHVHLVTHPRKTFKDSDRPGKVDVKGSGAITDLAHNVLVIWRPDEEDKADSKKPLPDTALIVKKNREFGTEGLIRMSFDKDTKKFYEE